MGLLEIGCCGAYCGTCPALKRAQCEGCKPGYEDGTRDLSKAKCRMKVCCMKRGLGSCADCGSYETCGTLRGFYYKNGYKYRKYEEATLFIRKNGYEEFLKIADKWKMQYGRYK